MFIVILSISGPFSCRRLKDETNKPALPNSKDFFLANTTAHGAEKALCEGELSQPAHFPAKWLTLCVLKMQPAVA
jgi:hypothetical protein